MTYFDEKYNKSYSQRVKSGNFHNSKKIKRQTPISTEAIMQLTLLSKPQIDTLPSAISLI